MCSTVHLSVHVSSFILLKIILIPRREAHSSVHLNPTTVFIFNSSKYHQAKSTSKSLWSNLKSSDLPPSNPKIGAHQQSMATRKFSDEPDKMFVHETKCSDVTETVSVKIKDFTQKISDLDNKQKPIVSPKLTIAGKMLSICVIPELESSLEFISVNLRNCSKETIKVTANFKASCGVNLTFVNQEIKVGMEQGFRKFLSDAAFVKWAGENEDIFSLEVKITLHTQSAGKWTTER